MTSNVSGEDVSYEEVSRTTLPSTSTRCRSDLSSPRCYQWMNYVSYNQFCLRICTAENSTYSAAEECQHTLSVLLSAARDYLLPLLMYRSPCPIVT